MKTYTGINNIDGIIERFFETLENDVSCGRHELLHGIYVNIDEYSTYSRVERQYESHRKYYDYQYLIDGTEQIELKPYSEDRCTSKYDFSDDYAFYSNEQSGECVMLQPEEGILIEPGKLHMPCLQIENNQSIHVKKAVVKIPVSLFHDIKLLVMDVDGTLTDGKIYMGSQGELMKAFDIKDGYGINVSLRENNIEPVIITGRKSEIVSNRCRELHINECYQGVTNKLQCLQDLVCKKNYDLSNVAYIGDDENDLECMKAVKEAGGLVACPADSIQSVQAFVDFVCLHDGGNGAVREFIEFLTL